jgi:Spy/CpxP family protein refolding chaperone
MTPKTTFTSLFSVAALALCGSIALAQQPPAPAPADDATTQAAPVERQAPANGAMQPSAMHHGMMQHGKMQAQAQHKDAGMQAKGHEGFRPEGMWWKNPMVVQKLALTPDQVTRINGVFEKSRLELIDLKANLEKQDLFLEPLMSANPVDTTKALAQIHKVAQARADLEESHARMLLGIRGVLTPEQWTKLSSHIGAGGPGGPGGPGAPGGFDGGRGRNPHVDGPEAN